MGVSTASKAKAKKAIVRAKKVARKKKPAPEQKTKFRSRGPHKCVVSADGRSLRGVHKMLAATITAGFDYDKAKKNGTLQEKKRDPTEKFIPIPECITKVRRLAYSKKEGIKLDAQMTRVAKLCFPHLAKATAIAAPLAEPAVPLMVLVDPMVRKRFFETGCAELRSTQTALKPYKPPTEALKKRITNAIKPLLPETLQILHYLARHGWHIAGTQVPVEKGIGGTPLDLLVVRPLKSDPTKLEYMVCELKNGCVRNWTHGKPMGAPFQDKLFTTHREYQAQLLLNERMFRSTFPQRAAHLHPSELLRPDREGLWIDHVPPWMKEREASLALRCGC